jgi:hypothetical protein
VLAIGAPARAYHMPSRNLRSCTLV